MVGFSGYLDRYDQLARVGAAADSSHENIDVFAELGSLLQSIGRPSSALPYLLRADSANFSFKRIGGLLANIYYDIGELEKGRSYLADKITSTDSPFHHAYRDHLTDLLAQSDKFAKLQADHELPSAQASMAIDAHLRAKRFDRVKDLIEDQDLINDSSPKLQAIFRIADLENKKQKNELTWELAVELSNLYRNSLRSRPQASLILSNLEDSLIYSERGLLAVCKHLQGLGNPIAAARYAHEYLKHAPDSRIARRVLVLCGEAMDDASCIANVADTLWMVDELAQAQRFAATYFDSVKTDDISRKNVFRKISISTSGLLSSISSADIINSKYAGLNLRIASYILNNGNKSLLIGLPTEVILALRNLPGFQDTPDPRVVEQVRLSVGKDFLPLDDRRPYTVKSLSEICSEERNVVEAGSDADLMSLLSPSRGIFEPIAVSDIEGTPVDSWNVRSSKIELKQDRREDGKSHHTACISDTFKTVPVYLARLKAAALIGRGFLVNRNGLAISDVQNDGVRRSAMKGNLQRVQTPWLLKARVVVGADNASLIYAAPLTGNVRYVEESCYLLDNGQGYNFANWHMYVYPRLFGYFESGLDKKGVKLVVYKDTSSRLIEILHGYGVKESDLYYHDQAEVSIFLELYVPSAMSLVEKLLAPQAFLSFDRVSVDSLVLSGSDPASRWQSGKLPRKVYLSRSDVARRRLINESRIEEIAIKNGYEVVLPAQLSPVDVIRLFREVDVICGPSGSSFLNMLYMKANSHAIMISHPAYTPTAYLCCQFGGLRDIGVSLIFGEMTGVEEQVGMQEEFKVDEDAVEAILSKY